MSTQCYVCARHPVQSEDVQRSSATVYRITCPRCGVYDIAHRYISGERNQPALTDIDRVRLSHAMRKATDAYGLFAEELLNYETVKPLLERHPLPDPVDQADIFVDQIGRRCLFGEPTPAEIVDVWAARIGLKGAEQLKAMCTQLEALIQPSGLGHGGGVAGNLHLKPVAFTLTLDGWKRAKEIRKDRGPGNQAFVAMWFAPAMDAAFDDGFAPALSDTGHSPYRVDRDVHNNKIDDQIVAELRRSKLAIVDATGARPNAYWEAGFAMGLGIPVIWCCNDSPTAPGLASGRWTDNLPFDIRQHSFIFWSDPADLRKKLTDKIRALGFDAAWNRQQ